MKKHYDFSKSKPNPYVGKAKRSITIRLDPGTIDYFRELAGKTGIPYQNLINMFLRDCAHSHKKPTLKWA